VRVLLVSPAFHGYWTSIARALEDQGHDCHVHVYDERAGLAAKLRAKVGDELPRRLGGGPAQRFREHATRAAVLAVHLHVPQLVLVVKGDTLGEEFWDFLHSRRLPRVIWLYDEIRRTEYTIERLAGLAPVASYSRSDTDRLDRLGACAAHVPLAFDPHLLPGGRSASTDDVVFVGARYPEREATLLALEARDVPVRAFGRDWSHHPVDRLRTWELRRPHLPAGRGLTREEAYRVMAAASSTLNMHADQDGFTMRTFEACGVGAVQLIDRPDVADLYEPGVELLAYSSLDELVDLCHRVRGDRRWAQRLRAAAQRRTAAEHTFAHRLRALEELWG